MPIMTAATVTLVSGSMTIRLPVTRLSRYWSAAMGSASRQRTTPMSLAPSSRAGTRRSVFRFSLLSIPTTSQIGRATCCSSDLLVGGDGFGQPPTYHPDVIGPELPGRHQAECLQVQLALDPNHLTDRKSDVLLFRSTGRRRWVRPAANVPPRCHWPRAPGPAPGGVSSGSACSRSQPPHRSEERRVALPIYWSAAMGSASRQRTTPMSLAPSSRAGTRRSVFRFSLLSIPTTSQIGRATCCSSDLLVGGDGFGQPPTYHPDVIGPELPGRHQAECLQVQLALDPNHL